MTLPLLSAARLACRRGDRLLFEGLDLDVAAGEVVWVRGQNGRGKTSLLRLVAGLSTPESGRVFWDGVPVRRSSAYRRQLAFVGHANALKEDLTVSEALEFLLHIHGGAHGAGVVDTALEHMGMHSRRHAPVRTLSQGQRRRVALARLAVAAETETWILDEPVDSLDADGAQRLYAMLGEHARRGGRVLLSSHQNPAAGLLPRELDLDRYCR